MRIAIASSDGINVNEHFGRAAFFRVYELNGGEHKFIELRDAVAACQHARSHNQTDFDRVLDLLSDCEAILVSKIGEGAASYIIPKGKRVFEVSGGIDEVLQYFIDNNIL